MEFLLTSLPKPEHPRLLAALRKVRTRDDPAIRSFPFRQFALFVGGSVVEFGDQLFALAGSAFVGDRYVSDFRNLEPTSLRMLRRAARTDPGSVGGAFTLVTVDRDQPRFEVLSDALNAFPAFRAGAGGPFAVSNNHYFVR